ncbi:MAG: CHAD domain-containing protein [Myxococcales bacterium]
MSKQLSMQAQVGQAVHRAAIELPRDVEVGDAFRLIALACLRHLTLNEAALAAGDTEGVHQMRVATRRLRAAISLFRRLFAERESEPVKAGLRWLTEQLGPLRDYDVLIEESLQSSAVSVSNEAAFAKLTEALRQRRSQKLAHAQSAIASERYRELVSNTTRWVLGGPWTTDPDPRLQRRRRQRLLPRAKKELQRRTKRAQKRLRALADLPPEQRHELRIEIKKLHYGVQFFAGLFPNHERRREKFLRHLQRLQDRLGELNDARVHQALAQELLDAPAPNDPALDGDEALALGLLQNHESAQTGRLVLGAKRDGQKLANLPAFWR